MQVTHSTGQHAKEETSGSERRCTAWISSWTSAHLQSVCSGTLQPLRAGRPRCAMPAL
jgi:hypothetical protein